ncbi:MAG: hypothetical protein AAF648_10975 [Pseudomonadota bacterium]
MSDERTRRIWLLALVPAMRRGRWVSAALILFVGTLIYGVGIKLWLQEVPERGYYDAWPVAIFFVCSVAYMVPVFHYISARTVDALEALRPFVADTMRPQLARAVEYRSLRWTLRTALTATLIWLIQSRMLTESWLGMWQSLTEGLLSFAMSLGPLLVWLTMFSAMSALLGNALFFRRLAAHLAVQIFEPGSYMPVGRMAVTSTLVTLGAFGLLSIMWLDGPVNWWTTLPAMALFAPLLVCFLLIPVLPIHRELVAQRAQAMNEAQAALGQALASPDDLAARATALALRREVARLPTWPFDVPAIIRFVSYAVIVPMTWAGAALIEILVNAILS